MSRRRKVPGWGRHPSSAERFHGVLILWQQPPRPLAPGLSRRRSSAAYGPGPSVFTIRARNAGTDRASVSQTAARRGDPAASANAARDLQALLPWRDPGPTQVSFRLPQNLLPSAAPPITQHLTPDTQHPH